MDFETVLKKLIGFFKKNNINYALIGGFALGLYGVVRSTNDLDFLIDKKHEKTLKDFMARNGYSIIYESENVVQFENTESLLGSVDFLYSFRKPSQEMFKRAVKKNVFDGAIALNVLIPEDIIGLKLQSLTNDSEREIFDLGDIKELMKINSKMRWDIIKKHFELFGRKELFQKLKSDYGTKE